MTAQAGPIAQRRVRRRRVARWRPGAALGAILLAFFASQIVAFLIVLAGGVGVRPARLAVEARAVRQEDVGRGH